MLKLQTDGSNKYTDHLDGAFIVWLSIVINKYVAEKATLSSPQNKN